jgi:predicted O-methyltransferase YrrM
MIPVVSWLDLIPFNTEIFTLLGGAWADGNVSDFELDVINRLVVARRAETIFEIGTFDGRTTLNMAAHSGQNARVYTLDLPADDIEAAALPLDLHDRMFIEKATSGARFIGTAASSKITQLYGDSANFDFSPFYNQVDLFFVDGSHAYDYVLHDSQTARNLIRKDGIILWHDYVNNRPTAWPGVVKALIELHERDPYFAGMQQIAGTSIVILDVGVAQPMQGIDAERRRSQDVRRDSRQPEFLLADLHVEVAKTIGPECTPISARVKATNIGRTDWLPSDAALGPVRLGSHLLDRDGSWLEWDFSRSALPGGMIGPGDSVEFEVELKPPGRGKYVLEFDLVADGIAWFSRNGSKTVRVPIEVI